MKILSMGLLPLILSTAINAQVEVVRELAQTHFIKITYNNSQVGGGQLTIDDPEVLKDLLATIKVEDTEKGLQVGLMAYGLVEFNIKDGPVIKAMFVRPNQLDRWHWGQIYLADTKFHEKVCEVISKKEGRKVDIMKPNQ